MTEPHSPNPHPTSPGAPDRPMPSEVCTAMAPTTENSTPQPPSDGTPADGSAELPQVLIEHGFITTRDAVVAHRIARRLARRSPEPDGPWPVALLTLSLRAVQDGSTAVDVSALPQLRPRTDPIPDDGLTSPAGLVTRRDSGAALPTLADVVAVPPLATLEQELSASLLIRSGLLRYESPLLYLDRYYQDELLIARELNARADTDLVRADLAAAEDALDAAAEGRNPEVAGELRLNEAQHRAVRAVLTQAVTVLTGGPGMGKTYALSGVLLALRAGLGASARIALAAPTGKAAARMTQSLKDAQIALGQDAVTLHRLLGFNPSNHTRFLHHRNNPLPHDVVIVDEASMVSLPLLARLVEALKPSARLLLIGDPDQLASVEAGCVLGDLIDGLPAHNVIRLTMNYRLAGPRVALAQAFRESDADAVIATLRDASTAESSTPASGELPTGTSDTGTVQLLTTDAPTLECIQPIVRWASQLHQVARMGDASAAIEVLEQARLLCAHRHGEFGVSRWNRLVEQELLTAYPHLLGQRMYPGRPVMVTRNDPGLGLFNGDTGVIISRDGQLIAAMATADGVREFSPWRLADLDTMYAMTIHKSQGSQATHVSVILPPTDSRLLTRELLYTAVTRSRRDLIVIGTEAALRLGVETPVVRASGLATRLRAQPSVSDAGALGFSTS